MTNIQDSIHKGHDITIAFRQSVEYPVGPEGAPYYDRPTVDWCGESEVSMILCLTCDDEISGDTNDLGFVVLSEEEN